MPELDALVSIPRASGGVLLLLAAAWSVGSLIVRRPAAQAGSWSESLGLPIVVGLNLVAWAGVVLGQLGLLVNGRSVWLLAGCAVLGAPRVMGRWLGSEARAKRRRVTSRPASWGLCLAATLGAITLGPALCPPTGWDELVYHHELPRRWLADGRPAFYPDLAYSGFPSLGEILFWLVAPIEHVIAPRLITWVCWISGVVLLYRLLRRTLAARYP
jgi:hypothetical protein